MSFARFAWKFALPAAFLAVGAVPASSAGILVEKALSLDLAVAMAQGAVERCRADGYHVSVTVVDRDGLIKVAFHDDLSGPHTIDTSKRKAYTSVTFKSASSAWATRVLTEPALAGLKDTWGTI